VLPLIVSVASGPAVTVSVAALLVKPEIEAVIWVVPRTVSVVARPLAMVATLVALDAQVAELVTSPVDASEYVAVAVNCFVTWTCTEAVVGVIATDTTLTVTVSTTALLVIPETEAVIWVVPRVRAVAIPPETEATLVADEAHVAELTDTAFPN